MKQSIILPLALLMLPLNGIAQRVDSLRNLRTEQVVVTGTRSAIDSRHLPLTVNVVDHEQLSEAYQSSVLPTLTAQVPGFFHTSRGLMGYGVSTDAAGTIKVRGIGGVANFLVLIDGEPQYAGLYGHPIPDMYQTSQVEAVEVVRGPASLYYGSNAMGGVMNILTRHLPADGMRTDVEFAGGSYGTMQAHVNNQLRAGKFSYTVGLNFNSTDGHRPNYEFEQYGGYLKTGYELSQNWRLVGNLNLTRFLSSNPGAATNPYIDNDQWISRGFASVAAENNYKRSSGAIRAFYDFGHHRINDGYHPGGTPRTAYYMHNDYNAGLSIYQSATLFSSNRTAVGLDWQHFGGEAWNEAIATRQRTADIADKKEDEIAGYVDFRQDLSQRLTVDLGLRVDHHTQAGTELVPQGGLVLRLPRLATLKATVSKGFRNPTLRELYMFKPANPELEPERLVNYELAYTQRFLDGRLQLGANVYYIDAENLISVVPTDGKPLNVNTGKAQNYGFELETHYRVNPYWRVDANYSFLHMHKAKVVGAPEHKFYVGGSYEARHWAFNSGLLYLGRLYTAVAPNERYEEVPLLNATLTYKPIENVRLFVRGENLFWQRYQLYDGFPMPRGTVMGGIHVSF